MAAKTNRYHYSPTSCDSAYNSREVTAFHMCYFTVHGLRDWIDIVLFYSSLTIVIYITSLYAAINTTHITHRVQHAH